MPSVDVPVLIVGGGGAGLTASMLLSQLGIETLLASALPTTSVLPKAHILNQRANGYTYTSSAIVSDGTSEPTALDAIRLVAWRSAGAAAHARRELGAALAQVLCRPID